MTDSPASTRERDGFFWILFLGLTFVGAAIAVSGYVFVLAPDPLKPLGEAKAWVTIGDLLTTLILASLITMPLTVVYLLGKEGELQVTITKETVFHLERTGAALASFRAAYLFLADPSTPDDLTPIVRALGEFAGVGENAEPGDGLSEEALSWLLPDTRRRRNFRRYFANGGDRWALTRTAIILGVAAMACFADLYLRFLGLRAVWLDVLEQVVVVLTAAYNVLAYVMLIRIVQLKAGIKRQAVRELRKMCGQVREQITTALSKSGALGRSVNAELRKGLEG